MSVPSTSSATLMSATLICVAVEVFSAIDVVVLVKLTDVGASFTLLTASENVSVLSGVAPTVVSSTLTVTE